VTFEPRFPKSRYGLRSQQLTKLQLIQLGNENKRTTAKTMDKNSRPMRWHRHFTQVSYINSTIR